MSQCHLYAVSQEIGSYHYVPKRVTFIKKNVFLVYLFICLVQLLFYDFMLMIIWFECHKINVDFL